MLKLLWWHKVKKKESQREAFQKMYKGNKNTRDTQNVQGSTFLFHIDFWQPALTKAKPFTRPSNIQKRNS